MESYRFWRRRLPNTGRSREFPGLALLRPHARRCRTFMTEEETIEVEVERLPADDESGAQRDVPPRDNVAKLLSPIMIGMLLDALDVVTVGGLGTKHGVPLRYGCGEWIAQRLVRVLDPDTRTVPIIYELPDPDSRLAIGQAVSLRVFVSAATEAITVPDSAIVDDAGQPVVFVQVAGESFERRAVELGNRESGLVQITGDVAPGERVVVRGAPLIRLAALSPQVPAHGHTH